MRQGGGGGGGAPPTDQTTNFFWILVMIIGGVLVAWWLDKSLIVHVIFSIKSVEVKFLLVFANAISAVANFLHLPAPTGTMKLKYWLHYMQSQPVTDVKFSDLGVVVHEVGEYLKYPVTLLCVAGSLFLYFRHGSSRFRKTYNLKSLKSAEVENWPQIVPVLKKDLVKQPLDDGPWAMSMQPLYFAKKYNLIEVVKNDKDEYVYQIKRGLAQRAFVMQLGPRWTSAQHLPIHLKALFVMFMARIHRQREYSEQLIKQIAISASSGKLNFSGVEEKVKEFQNSSVVAWLAKRHAYVSTLMSTLLDICRTDGVLASAEFLWLKPLDRKMWYVLNGVGRQTAFSEVAGVFAHWLAEKKTGTALKVPMVKEAVNGLEAAVKEILYVAEGDEWRSVD